MAFNEKESLIFIHVRKTAGTSIEKYLFNKDTNLFNSRNVSPSIASLNTTLRSNKYKIKKINHLTYNQYFKIFCKQDLSFIGGKISNEVKRFENKRLNSDVFSSCFKFTCVRDPYERLISQWANHIYPKKIRKYKKKPSVQKLFREWMSTIYIDTVSLDHERLLQVDPAYSRKVLNYRVCGIVANPYHHYLAASPSSAIDLDLIIDFDHMGFIFDNELPHSNIGRYSSTKSQFSSHFAVDYLFDSSTRKIFDKFNEKDLDFYQKFKESNTPEKFTTSLRRHRVNHPLNILK